MTDETIADPSLEEKTEIEFPKNYKVVLLNDDFTPMEFVVQILTVIFQKSHADAIDLMLQVHENGRGVAGIYVYEIATQKSSEVIATARQFEYPLRATIEEDR